MSSPVMCFKPLLHKEGSRDEQRSTPEGLSAKGANISGCRGPGQDQGKGRGPTEGLQDGGLRSLQRRDGR